ncbi:hypothetical protein UlMin_011804 [Ulmus minor]
MCRIFNETGEGSGVKMGGIFSKGGTSGKNFLPRTLKLDFPRYDGRDDPVTWMSQAEKYLLLRNIAKSDKVALSSFYLEGDAQLDGFLSRFGQNQFEDPFSELIKLQKIGSVIDYQSRFESINQGWISISN